MMSLESIKEDFTLIFLNSIASAPIDFTSFLFAMGGAILNKMIAHFKQQ